MPVGPPSADLEARLSALQAGSFCSAGVCFARRCTPSSPRTSSSSTHDLGIGKAPGGLPDATRALRRRHALAESVAFDDLLAELDRYLAPPETGSLRALPTPPAPPERFLLGASPDSARTAAALGWRFVYAGQLNGDPRATEGREYLRSNSLRIRIIVLNSPCSLGRQL